MLEASLVIGQPELIEQTLRQRRASEEALRCPAEIARRTRARAAAVARLDEARASRKRLSKEIGALYKSGQPQEAAARKAEVAGLAETIQGLEAEVREHEQAREPLLLSLPNLLDERVPDGSGEEDNQELSRWGCEELSQEATAHDVWATERGWLDLDAASKIAGARFAVLRGPLARLERALISWFLDLHCGEHGYTEVMVPYLVNSQALLGTGQLPKFEEDLFKLQQPLSGQDAYLIPTAEVPVTNLHREEILSEEELTLSYAAFTPCFRSEAGSHGRDTRGLIRQHQFHKVELVKITTPEASDAEHEALTAHAEACLKALELPFRRQRLCSGDISFSARHCYDLEVWLPSQGCFREISSCSNFGDFQARRMKLRYRPAGVKQKPRFCHTINGSGLAVGRTLVAILEHYQDGPDALVVPEVLRPYLGGLDRL